MDHRKAGSGASQDAARCQVGDCEDSKEKERREMIFQCQQCGKELEAKHQNQKFCSVECHNIAQTFKVKTNCRTCGKAFEASRCLNQKYCSHKCSAIAVTKPNQPCGSCGKMFHAKGTQKYCTPKCGFDSRKQIVCPKHKTNKIARIESGRLVLRCKECILERGSKYAQRMRKDPSFSRVLSERTLRSKWKRKQTINFFQALHLASVIKQQQKEQQT